jgi:hypothetical protein
MPVPANSGVRLGFTDGSSMVLDESNVEMAQLRSIADSLASRTAPVDKPDAGSVSSSG